MSAKKSLEQRIHAAVRHKTGLRLSAQDVVDLAWLDDAILVRLANKAAREGGNAEPGAANQQIFAQTWAQLKGKRHG